MKTDQYRCSLYKINGSFFGKIPHPLNFMALQKSGNFSKANQHQRILKSSICFYLYLSVVSIVFLALLTSCTAGQGSATPTAVPTPIVSEKPTYTVQRGTVTQVVNLTGRVMPSKQQDLSFATSGYVKEVFFKQGDAVKAGDVIARLDGLERYQADIAGAQLALDQANYALQTLKENAPLTAAQDYQKMVQAKADLDKAQSNRLALNYPRVNDPLELKKLQQDVDLAGQAVNAAQIAYNAAPDDAGRLNSLLSAQDALKLAQQRLELGRQQAHPGGDRPGGGRPGAGPGQLHPGPGRMGALEGWGRSYPAAPGQIDGGRCPGAAGPGPKSPGGHRAERSLRWAGALDRDCGWQPGRGFHHRCHGS